MNAPILHLFPAGMVHIHRHYIRFINTHFDAGDHVFLLVGQVPSELLARVIPEEIRQFDNVTFYNYDDSKERASLLTRIDQSRLIVCHSLTYPVRMLVHMLLKPSRMRRFVWVSWGRDMTSWGSSKGSLRRRIGYYFRCRVPYFVGIFEPDIETFKRIYRSEARTFLAGYPVTIYSGLEQLKDVTSSLPGKIKKGLPINVMIGHSSTDELRHLDVIRDLAHLKDQNFRFYFPLTYGDTAYGDDISAKATEVFGEKAICMRDNMPLDNYRDFLASVDIAIFNTDRQIALGNIHPLLYMGKTIYLPRESVLSKHYRAHGVPIADYESLATSSYDDFATPRDAAKSRAYVETYELDMERFISDWSDVFVLASSK
ncbi:MAG: TDP-N-acetylfucosamine:lipid II N-acetylfucosaminyltransferase [Clostridiaceae bacterium]|jgi:hypothetical protein|nr:TDP-N-acetylfucosamine:lipid II N-acetylfucosaminyltransferase [Clostridiaceae bacterium]